MTKDLTNLSILELASELQDVEKRKANFETQLKAVASFYFEAGQLRIDFQTNDYNDKGTDEPIRFTKEIFIEYLKREISHLEKTSNRIIEELTKPIA